MDLIQGGKKIQIAGAKIGDTIMVHLTSNKLEKIVLADVNKIGIEGFQIDLMLRPLTFYPYTAIIKVTKFNDVE
jgi:malate/lactate dehydrogenase